MALQMALAPCLLGYGAIAGHIHANEASKRVDNPYWTWVTNYVAEDYVQAVKTGSGMFFPLISSTLPLAVYIIMSNQRVSRHAALLERHASTLSPTRVEEIVQIFIHATKVSGALWSCCRCFPEFVEVRSAKILPDGDCILGDVSFEIALVDELEILYFICVMDHEIDSMSSDRSSPIEKHRLVTGNVVFHRVLGDEAPRNVRTPN